MTASLAGDKHTSVDAAVETVLFQLGGTFTLEEEQRTVLKTFYSEKDVSALLPIGFG